MSDKVNKKGIQQDTRWWRKIQTVFTGNEYYTTKDGTKITVDKGTGDNIFYDENGNLVVKDAKDAYVKGSKTKDNEIIFEGTDLSKYTGSDMQDTVTIEGGKSGKVDTKGGKGDSVTVSNGAKTGTIKTASADAKITVEEGTQTGTIKATGGNTNVQVDGAKTGKIKTTADNATVDVEHSNTGHIVTNGDNSSTHVSDSNVSGVVKQTGDDSNMVVEDSRTGKLKSTGDNAQPAASGQANDPSIQVSNSNVGKIAATGDGTSVVTDETTKVDGKVTIGTDGSIDAQGTQISGKFIARDGADVTMDGVEVGGKAIFRGDNDTDIDNSTFKDKVTIQGEQDNFQADNTTFEKNVNLNYGDQNISLNASEIKGDVNIDNGNKTLNLTESAIDGHVSIYDDGNGTAQTTINADHSRIGSVSASDTASTAINSKDSAIGNQLGIDNYNQEVTSLDTSEGSVYEGFNLVEAKDGEDGSKVYTLSDGTKVQTAKGDAGELYINEETGEVILNGINEAEVIQGDDSQYSISSLNSSIKSYEGNSEEGVLALDNSVLTDAKTDETLNVVSSDSIVRKMEGEGADSEINFGSTNSSVDKIINKEGDINIANSQDTDYDTIKTRSGNITLGSEVQNEDGTKGYTFSGGNIKDVETGKGSIEIHSQNVDYEEITAGFGKGTIDADLSGGSVSKKVKTYNGDLNVELSNGANVSKIKTNDGNVTVDATDSTIGTIKGDDGDSTIHLKNTKVEEKIKFDNGKTEFVAEDSEVNKLILDGDESTIAGYQTDFGKIKLEGDKNDVALYASKVEHLNAWGQAEHISAQKSIIGDVEGTDDDVTWEDSVLSEDHKDALEFGHRESSAEFGGKMSDQNRENTAVQQIDQIRNRKKEERDAIFGEEGIPEDTKTQMLSQMDAQLAQLKQEYDVEVNAMGAGGFISSKFGGGIDQKQADIQALEEVISMAKAEGADDETIMSAYKLVVGDSVDAQEVKDVQDAKDYADTLSDDDISTILDSMEDYGRYSEWDMVSEDGEIKKKLSVANKALDIGTNKNEAQGYIDIYNQGVQDLRDKLNNGTLTKEEFAVEYKKLTGNNLSEESVARLTDKNLNNDGIENSMTDEIQNYQDTQQKIEQVAETTAVITASVLLSVATGGIASPLAATLVTTTGTFATSEALAALERETNCTGSDDLTSEEVAQNAVLMYSGALIGSVSNMAGNAVGNAVRKSLGEKAATTFLGRTAAKAAETAVDWGIDIGLSAGTNAIMTGNADVEGEIRSQLIGIATSKITQFARARKAAKAAKAAQAEIEAEARTRTAQEQAIQSAQDAEDARIAEMRNPSASHEDMQSHPEYQNADGGYSAAESAKFFEEIGLTDTETKIGETTVTVSKDKIMRTPEGEIIKTPEGQIMYETNIIGERSIDSHGNIYGEVKYKYNDDGSIEEIGVDGAPGTVVKSAHDSWDAFEEYMSVSGEETWAERSYKVFEEYGLTEEGKKIDKTIVTFTDKDGNVIKKRLVMSDPEGRIIKEVTTDNNKRMIERKTISYDSNGNPTTSIEIPQSRIDSTLDVVRANDSFTKLSPEAQERLCSGIESELKKLSLARTDAEIDQVFEMYKDPRYIEAMASSSELDYCVSLSLGKNGEEGCLFDWYSKKTVELFDQGVLKQIQVKCDDGRIRNVAVIDDIDALKKFLLDNNPELSKSQFREILSLRGDKLTNKIKDVLNDNTGLTANVEKGLLHEYVYTKDGEKKQVYTLTKKGLETLKAQGYTDEQIALSVYKYDSKIQNELAGIDNVAKARERLKKVKGFENVTFDDKEIKIILDMNKKLTNVLDVEGKLPESIQLARVTGDYELKQMDLISDDGSELRTLYSFMEDVEKAYGKSEQEGIKALNELNTTLSSQESSYQGARPVSTSMSEQYLRDNWMSDYSRFIWRITTTDDARGMASESASRRIATQHEITLKPYTTLTAYGLQYDPKTKIWTVMATAS